MGLADHCNKKTSASQIFASECISLNEKTVILFKFADMKNWSKGLEMRQNNLKDKVIRQVG